MQLDWDVFLARLQHDLGASVRLTQLFPSSAPQAPAQPDSADAVTAVRELLARNGPVLAATERIEIERIVAVTSAPSPQPTSAKRLSDATDSGKRTPSLHFGDAGPDVWTAIARRAAESTTTRASSARRLPHRRLPSTRAFATTSNACGSEIRQLSAHSTAQFARIACDVPLSSSPIAWLLRDLAPRSTESHAQRWHDLLDTNVYIDMSEYAPSLQRLKDALAQSQDHKTTRFVASRDALASARRAFERALQALATAHDGASADRQRHAGVCLAFCASDDRTRAAPRTFVRASVLQLVQTTYYANVFLPRLAPSDTVALEHLCGSVLPSAVAHSAL